jgi:hypothetical protein
VCRSAAAATETTVAASVAHVLAGGQGPSASFIAGFGAVVLAGCLARASRAVRISSVAALVLGAQVGLHALLDPHVLNQHSGSPGMTPMDNASSGLTGPMLYAHTVSALVALIVLLGQERVLALVVAWWSQVTGAPTVLAPRPSVLAGSPPSVDRRTGLLALSPRRGPPPLAAAAP